MVDSFNTPDQAPVDEGVAPQVVSSGSGAGGFLSTTVGKLVVGGIALVVVVGAIAAILIMFVLNQPGGDGGDAVVVPATGTTTTASAESSPTERPADEIADTFVFRNIFKPTVKITVSTDSDTDGTAAEGTDSENADIPADTLYLSSITTVDGEAMANLIWNGGNYALTEGDSISGTPWQVLNISDGAVVMLYGDARVTLTVGQGISK